MMTPEMSEKLKRSIVKHESYRKFPYVDTVGKITVGIGYNISDRGMSDEWIIKQYNEDVNYFYNCLYNYRSWFKDLCPDRQIVLCDMCFMGYKKLMEFKNMFSALAIGNYDAAADEMLNSEWARQVGQRAIDLADAMRTGVYNV